MSWMQFCVRPTVPSDSDAVEALIGSLCEYSGVARARQFASDVRAQIPALLRGDANPEVLVLVAADERSGELRGLVVLTVQTLVALHPAQALNVSHLIVEDRWRRHGVGRALLAAAVREADERGITQIVATAVSGSREANRYLSRLGFAPLVTQRVATVPALRRSLGLGEDSQRVARLRKLRSIRREAALAPTASLASPVPVGPVAVGQGAVSPVAATLPRGA